MNKVKIYGGLGNQMFQYALCIALNQKGNKTRISFSDFLFEYHHNGFNLSRAFKLKFPFPFPILNFFLTKCEFLYKNKYVGYFSRRIIQLYHKKFYNTYSEEKEFIFDYNVFQQRSSFIVGIWQVESYFKNIKSQIEQEFEFSKPTDSENIKLINNIKKCESVSIHIRKGDYETRHWKDILGFMDNTKYYNNALNYINAKLENPHFFIFSDDIEWAKNNFQLSKYTYIDHNKGKLSYIDMYLMSLCKHNIIANSTFSWWGAWLNKNENKIVIMPDKWINKDYSPEGIFPQEWIKISDSKS